jgi:hypothetical protein
VIAAAVSSVREGIKKLAGAFQMLDAVQDSPAVVLTALVNICAVLAVPPLCADAVPFLAGAAGAAADALTEALRVEGRELCAPNIISTSKLASQF